MSKILRPALVLFAALSLLTGLAYPLLTTALAQALFPQQANGSLIENKGQLIGSRLIGQQFSGDKYFWGRPSATSPQAYNAGSSSGSNLGPTNPAQRDTVKANIERLRKAHPDQSGTIPVDLVTASASGLDPEISLAAAYYQLERVARARGMPLARLHQLVDDHAIDETFGLLGEPRVNVLELNLALDAVK